MNAGHLHHQYSFQKRSDVSDGAGNTKGDWSEVFVIRGSRKFFRGVEKASDAASTGYQKAILKIRNCLAARSVTTAWRIVDKRSGETYNILAVETLENRQYIEFVVQSGGPDG